MRSFLRTPQKNIHQNALHAHLNDLISRIFVSIDRALWKHVGYNRFVMWQQICMVSSLIGI